MKIYVCQRKYLKYGMIVLVSKMKKYTNKTYCLRGMQRRNLRRCKLFENRSRNCDIQIRACLKTPNYCFFLPKKGCLLCLKGLKYRQNFAVFFLIFTLLG